MIEVRRVKSINMHTDNGKEIIIRWRPNWIGIETLLERWSVEAPRQCASSQVLFVQPWSKHYCPQEMKSFSEHAEQWLLTVPFHYLLPTLEHNITAIYETSVRNHNNPVGALREKQPTAITILNYTLAASVSAHVQDVVSAQFELQDPQRPCLFLCNTKYKPATIIRRLNHPNLQTLTNKLYLGTIWNILYSCF